MGMQIDDLLQLSKVNRGSPDRFIPAAERYNLMPEIDRWVIRHACQQLQRIEVTAHPPRCYPLWGVSRYSQRKERDSGFGIYLQPSNSA
ncbi:MAG: EAL domain-containing protein [Gammaproteobacteria bacterium]|nr:EAL domain-containing protein [Gammaproteobacteria bacterium]